MAYKNWAVVFSAEAKHTVIIDIAKTNVTKIDNNFFIKNPDCKKIMRKSDIRTYALLLLDR